MVNMLPRTVIVAFMVWDWAVSVYALVMAMKVRDKPSALAPSPWPEMASADPIAEIARQFALNLRDAIGADTVRSVATRTSVGHPTVLNILAGRVWPDLATIAKLERGLQVRLWPTEHLPIE